MPSRYRFWSSVSLSMSKASWLGYRRHSQARTQSAVPIFPSDSARYLLLEKAKKAKVLPEAFLSQHAHGQHVASFLPTQPHSPKCLMEGKRATTNRFKPGDLRGQAVSHPLVLSV